MYRREAYAESSGFVIGWSACRETSRQADAETRTPDPFITRELSVVVTSRAEWCKPLQIRVF